MTLLINQVAPAKLTKANETCVTHTPLLIFPNRIAQVSKPTHRTDRHVRQITESRRIPQPDLGRLSLESGSELPVGPRGIKQNVSGPTFASDLHLAFLDIEKRSTDAPLTNHSRTAPALGQKKP
jgi:hypothetical protein